MIASWTDRSAVCVAASESHEDDGVLRDLERALVPCEPSLILFFASSYRNLAGISRGLARQFPQAVTAGCTTMGEIGPLGLTRGAVSAFACGGPSRAAAVLVEDLAAFRVDDGYALVRRLARDLGLGIDELCSTRHVLVTLVDGLSGREEILGAGLDLAAPGIPIVGGSAGDDFRFERTLVAHGGVACSGGAVVILLEPGAPFHPFHLTHHHPTDERLVVTRAVPQRRLVLELNGRPALSVMASILNLTEEQLRLRPVEEISDAGVQFGYRMGSRFYLRSVMTVQGTALRLGGTVEAGAILAIMRAGDIVEETRAGLAEALASLGGRPAGQVCFNCGGRLHEAHSRGVTEAFDRAMRPVPTAGFTTYAEQFGPMLVNHTLTGLVLGRPDEP